MDRPAVCGPILFLGFCSAITGIALLPAITRASCSRAVRRSTTERRSEIRCGVSMVLRWVGHALSDIEPRWRRIDGADLLWILRQKLDSLGFNRKGDIIIHAA